MGVSGCLPLKSQQAGQAGGNESLISDAGNWRGGWQTSVQRSTHPYPSDPLQAGGESFYRQSGQVVGEGSMRKQHSHL